MPQPQPKAEPAARLRLALTGLECSPSAVGLLTRAAERLDARSGVQGTGSQSVNGEPMDRSECKGCLWIDLDERIEESQKSRIESQTVVVGLSLTMLFADCP